MCCDDKTWLGQIQIKVKWRGFVITFRPPGSKTEWNFRPAQNLSGNKTLNL
jgi:hypothetical protein